MTDPRLELVAVAILKAMVAHQPRRIRPGGDSEYEECQAGCKYEVGGSTEHRAPLLAKAALDALTPNQSAAAEAARRAFTEVPRAEKIRKRSEPAIPNIGAGKPKSDGPQRPPLTP